MSRTDACTPGTHVVHRRYVPYSAAHYAGNLVDGAYTLALFGDVATELCLTTDQDEGLLAAYREVDFRAPVRGGDVLEVRAELVRVGNRAREMSFVATVVGRGMPQAGGPGSGQMLAEPIVATTATGTCIVPAS